MAYMVPAERPKISKEELLAQLAAAHPKLKIPDFLVVGIRGYYLNTMGDKGKNDRMIYDDAILLVGKDEGVIAFNGNTDPAGFKLNIANLKPGIWPVYKFAKHKNQYMALCQRAGDVTVIRDGDGKEPAKEDTGSFGINIHHGGTVNTSSLGCQTLPPSQWKEFIDKAQELAKKYNGDDYAAKVYTYVLLENKPAAVVKEPDPKKILVP